MIGPFSLGAFLPVTTSRATFAFLESKAGYVSGSSPTSRYVIQANKLALAGQQLGVPVQYYFYGGVSEPFKGVLRSLGIGWWII
jgi:hypothetical protein